MLIIVLDPSNYSKLPLILAKAFSKNGTQNLSPAGVDGSQLLE